MVWVDLAASRAINSTRVLGRRACDDRGMGTSTAPRAVGLPPRAWDALPYVVGGVWVVYFTALASSMGHGI